MAIKLSSLQTTLPGIGHNMPGIGHNSPPADKPLSIRARLTRDYAKTLSAVDSAIVLGNSAPQTIASENDLATLAFAAKELDISIKGVEKARKHEKDEYIQAGKDVDGFFNPLKARAATALAPIMKIIDDYNNKKLDAARLENKRLMADFRAASEAAQDRANKQIEQAARIEGVHKDVAETIMDAALTSERAAAASKDEAERIANIPTKELVKSNLDGITIGMKPEWKFEITDFTAIDLNELRPFFTMAEIEKSLRCFVNSGRHSLNGVRIFEVAKSTIR